MSARASVLAPPPQPLWLPLLFALMLHGCVGGTVVLAGMLSFAPPKRPMIDPRENIEVSLVQIKGSTQLPTRETVAPVPTGKVEAKEPPKPAVKESDLAFKTPEAPQPKGAPDRSAEREALMRELDRKRALEAALEGTRDREATDPNSTATETIRAGTGTMRAEPELARYMMTVETLFNDHFKPLKPIVDANPGISADYHVDFDPDTGRILGFSPYKRSGNASYDAAVERAIQAIANVPLPPAKYRDIVGSRFTINFVPR